MKRAAAVTFLCMAVFAPAVHAVQCADFWDWVNKGCRHIVDTYDNGSNELLVSGYSWHLPWTWTAERRREENEYAWGGGLARTLDRPDGDSESVFFLVFKDSHRQAQFNLGYAWRTYWGEREKLQAGLGYTVVIIQRPDIAGGWPVPVILPLATLRSQKVEVLSTFIPTLNGGVNHGSVLYLFGKISLE
jgi:lipid IVA palmitoyltransferase